jgi:hypothetical protein
MGCRRSLDGAQLMTARRWIMLSGAAWVLGAAFFQNDVLMYVAGAAHLLYWPIHTLEVKVNKLLDHHRIVVTQRDLNSAD